MVFRGSSRCRKLRLAISYEIAYNNPYFDGESNDGNIIVWYFSLSNNIINLVLEKISAFDLDDEKNKIKLLIDEGILYHENKDNYALYSNTHEMKQDKLEYFKKTCEMIYDMDSYSFLTRDYDRPEHIKKINDRKIEKTGLLWRVPTPEKNNVEVETHLPNSVNQDTGESEPEAEPEDESDGVL